MYMATKNISSTVFFLNSNGYVALEKLASSQQRDSSRKYINFCPTNLYKFQFATTIFEEICVTYSVYV